MFRENRPKPITYEDLTKTQKTTLRKAYFDTKTNTLHAFMSELIIKYPQIKNRLHANIVQVLIYEVEVAYSLAKREADELMQNEIFAGEEGLKAAMRAENRKFLVKIIARIPGGTWDDYKELFGEKEKG